MEKKTDNKELFDDQADIQTKELTTIKNESMAIAKSKDELKLLLFLNKKPDAKYIKKHPMIKVTKNGQSVPHEYLPVTYLRTLLDTLYPNYSYEIKETKLIANSIQTTVRLYLTDWNGNQFFRDGVGAQKIQVNKDKSPIDMNEMKADGIQMAAPSSATYAFKNACATLGNIFGRGMDSDIEYNVANSADLKEMVNEKYNNLLKD